MKILIACEESGIVREAFRANGHDAWSCDVLETRIPGQHIKGDALEAAYGQKWDMMIGHPECTYLAVCQTWRCRRDPARALKETEAIEFFRKLWEAPIERICLENPKSVASTRVAPKSQTIHPWQFGHPEQKTTWLWLKNLPLLMPTQNVYDHMMTLPKKKRERESFMPVPENTDRATGQLPIQELPKQWQTNGARYE